MAEALQGLGNLWDHLTELHHKDPNKYKEVIEESAKEYAKLKLPPLPHTCVLARDKVIPTGTPNTTKSIVKM